MLAMVILLKPFFRNFFVHQNMIFGASTSFFPINIDNNVFYHQFEFTIKTQPHILMSMFNKNITFLNAGTYPHARKNIYE